MEASKFDLQVEEERVKGLVAVFTHFIFMFLCMVMRCMDRHRHASGSSLLRILVLGNQCPKSGTMLSVAPLSRLRAVLCTMYTIQVGIIVKLLFPRVDHNAGISHVLRNFGSEYWFRHLMGRDFLLARAALLHLSSYSQMSMATVLCQWYLHSGPSQDRNARNKAVFHIPWTLRGPHFCRCWMFSLKPSATTTYIRVNALSI
jgi:hypothetical protein